MKSLKFTVLLILFGGFYLSAKPIKNSKRALPLKRQEVILNLGQFTKYLEIGNPNDLEGVYRTPDKRYTIAFIKNKERQHDFIGVVIAADNSYWHSGEIKFNLVKNENDKLNGYYYDSQGKAYPVTFKMTKKGIQSRYFKKMKMAEVKQENLASL